VVGPLLSAVQQSTINHKTQDRLLWCRSVRGSSALGRRVLACSSATILGWSVIVATLFSYRLELPSSIVAFGIILYRLGGIHSYLVSIVSSSIVPSSAVSSNVSYSIVYPIKVPCILSGTVHSILICFCCIQSSIGKSSSILSIPSYHLLADRRLFRIVLTCDVYLRLVYGIIIFNIATYRVKKARLHWQFDACLMIPKTLLWDNYLLVLQVWWGRQRFLPPGWRLLD
jgi:hypothetical protein